MFRFKGASASGLGTCLVDPELKVVLDIGFCSREAVKYRDVFITHAHVDHLAGAISHAATRDLRKLEPSRFFCPPSVERNLRKLFEVWEDLQGGVKYEIVPLDPEDVFCLRPGVNVRPFRTLHRLPSQGYIFYEVKTKLKADFTHLIGQGKELFKLAQSGVQLNEVVETPVMAYTGDTLPEALGHPDVQRATLLVAECTFLDDKVSILEARQKGHTHLDELRQYVQGRDSETLCLFHFSDRYTEQEIWNALDSGRENEEHPLAYPFLNSGGMVDWQERNE